MTESVGLFASRLERFRYAWLRMKEEGFAWTALEIVQRALFLPLGVLLLPVTLVLHLGGSRRLTVITERVGHFSAEIDCFLKLQRLGRLPRRRYFVLAPPGRISNRCLAGYWARKLPMVRQPLVCAVLSAMSRFGLMRHDVGDYVLTVAGAATYFRVNAEWAARAPLLELTAEHAAWGRARLAELGVSRDAPFVCLHVREGGYSVDDEKVHGFRNVSMDAAVPAIKVLADRGIWCLRMGDPSMTPLPATRGAIDYAHHPLRSAELDVFLCASCRFFLGSSSGLYVLSSVFGVPCALANMVPFANTGFAPNDVGIPKLLYSERERRYLRFKEILSAPVANYRMGRMFYDAGLRPIENSPEEITDLALEMLDRLEGSTEPYDPLESLQAAFKQLLRPTHYCYGAPSRMGARFLERHRDLLEA